MDFCAYLFFFTFFSPQDQDVQIAAVSDKSSATESLVTTQQAIVEDLKNKVQLLDSENAGKPNIAPYNSNFELYSKLSMTKNL